MRFIIKARALRRRLRMLLWGVLAGASVAGGQAQGPGAGGVAGVLEAAGPLTDPAARREAVEAVHAIGREQRRAGAERAQALGLPERIERRDGTVLEVAGVDPDGRLLYRMTYNDQAAISSGARALHIADPPLDGAGVTIGIWDGGAVRASHQEFAGGRVVVMDGASPIAHATHVGGTLAAAGVEARARGMAYAAALHSYDWNDDKAEMTERAAAAPDDADALFLSNHSYGFVAGWYRTGGSDPAFTWYGSGTTASATDPRFGQYNTQARDSDAIAHAAPYYLMFRAAGNDRLDNPAAGQLVQLSPGATTTVAYDPAAHPPGDGVYRGGYDTLSFDAVAKNVMVVGSVTDAVTNDGERDPSVAEMTALSSWGPTDDGRIKPDLVANGHSLYSTLNGDDSYGSMSGTSMSSPNAAGTAALLIQEYGRLFPGHAMRSSTLRGLLIHTADDLGNPGPDYRFGWGLINGAAAAELIRDHAAHSLKLRMGEHEITSSDTTVTHAFIWDGASPIRVTLAWTDPAGAATTSADLRSTRLRNNLDLKVIGPDGSEHYPYVMPFVGTWTEASMSVPATTGVNNTDNVEQVFIAAPPAAGVYRALVSYQGTLADHRQVYSLLISGSADEEPPPPPLTVAAVSPSSAAAGGTVTLELEGTALETATGFALRRDGFADRMASGIEMAGAALRGQVDLAGAAAGAWDIAVWNAAETAVLPAGFAIIGAIWSENFDGAVEGWTSVQKDGESHWTVSTAQSHSSPASAFAPGPATRTTTAWQSPAIAVPAGVTGVELSFWHAYQLENRRDGGRLEFAIDGGTWAGAGDSGTGTVFASNGYNASIQGTGAPTTRSTFAGQSAWTGDSGGFIRTLLQFTNDAAVAGRSLQFRWVLATDASNASPGWHVDTIVLTAGGDLGNQPPAITAPAHVVGADTVTEEEETVYLVSDTPAELAVAAEDDGGPENLTYTWAAAGPAPVFMLPNGTVESVQTTASFEASGDYAITVTVTDDGGLSASSTVRVRVVPVARSVRVDPDQASLRIGETQRFAATLLDQFDVPMAGQPDGYLWSVSGGGDVSGSGLFLAASAGENIALLAETEAAEGQPNGISGFALVTVIADAAGSAIRIGAIETRADGGARISVPAVAGLEYRLEYRDRLAPDDGIGWQPAGAWRTGADGESLTFEDADTSVATRFYRLRARLAADP